jgi:hypothetical protein
MRSSTLFYSLHNGFRAAKPVSLARIFRRNSSTDALSEYVLANLEAHLRKELSNRPPVLIGDVLSPTHSHLLDLSLQNSIPEECYPHHFKVALQNLQNPEPIPKLTRPSLLPQGHHLVYFPPLIPTFKLLRDGTDTLHSPGHPWVRRMWAGGSLEFNDANLFQLRLRNQEALCEERISDVVVKGTEGDEKIFVTIERIVSHPSTIASRERVQEYLKERMAKDSEYMGEKSLVEKRTLVFMRKKTREEALEDATKPGKVVKRMQTNSSTYHFH